MRLQATVLVGFAILVLAGLAQASSPFSDLPQGHWSYEAVRRAANAGLMRHFDGNFSGKKVATRYEMATLVAGMLQRLETMSPGKVGKATLANLEALALEFGDELALLSVKVCTLEDSVAELKKDVSSLKTDAELSGAGIRGLVQTRLVLTGDDPNLRLGRGDVAGTGPISRFTGGFPNGAPNAANTIAGSGRTFFNIAQLSLGVDRHIDDSLYLHLQLDFDADQEAGFWNGSTVQVNEAYVDLEKLIADGGVRLRAGAWALPFSRERNPEMVEYPEQLHHGFRTLDLTVTPTQADQTWEQVRLQGFGLWNGKSSDLMWQTGVTNTPGQNVPGLVTADGTLLTYRGARVNNATPSVAQNDSRSPVGLGFGQAVWGDALQGIDTNNLGSGNSIGLFGWVGDKRQSGLRWDAGYFANGGNLNPVAGDIGTGSDWHGYQLNAGWTGWENWKLMGSYFGASSSSFNGGGVALGAAANAIGSGLVTGALPAGVNYPDLDSQSWSFLINRRLNASNDVTLRYERAEDHFGPAELLARVWTLGWNHRVSAHNLLQLEWSRPETENVAAAPTAAGYSSAAFGRNATDVDDNLLTLNLKVAF